MHKFIDNIVAFSLKNKFFIFFCTVIAVIAGAVSFKHTPIDAFPDVTNTKVTIITQWAGRSAEEVEKFITIPIEIAMNPVQKKTDIRSTTLFGLSVINVMFEDRVDDFTARQQVYNLLNDADLPEGVTPEVQPLYGPTGEIYRYTLRSDRRSVRDLKTIQDWVIERNLRSVSGVADIVSFGGEVKTFEVSVNPHQLINYGITSLELYDAIAKSNINVGGDVITKSSQAYVVRGIGLINDLDELRNIVVKNINGTPILVKNLADVHESCLPRLGQVGRMDENDVVQGIVEADLCILVAEPTVFGVNDMRICIDLLNTYNKPFGIVINKSLDTRNYIKTFCREHNIKVLAEIPLSPELARINASGQLAAKDAEYSRIFKKILKNAQALLGPRLESHPDSVQDREVF